MASEYRGLDPTSPARMNISVVIPARNEAENLPIVLNDLAALPELVRPQWIQVCDNGSSDDTSDVAQRLGAHVAPQPVAGYGLACLTALAQLPECDVVVFVDADQRVIDTEWQALLAPLHQGADLVIGARVDAERGALTPQQAWGNRFATGVIRWVFGFAVTDLGPFRAIRQSCLTQLEMQDRAYGWTVEMQLKAHLAGFDVVEVPVRARRRLHGQSMISGTLRGTVGAGIGILMTIARSTGWRWQRRKQFS